MPRALVDSINNFGNVNIAIKRLFISFAQQYFAERTDYPWLVDVVATRIIIADKYSMDISIAEKKPAIYISREPYRWSYATIGQRDDPSPEGAILPFLGIDKYLDLIQGHITYNCVAKNGVVAEDIANTLFFALTAFKLDFKKKGIHVVRDITLGNETLVKTDSDITLTLVPVTISYEANKQLGISKQLSSLELFIDEYLQYQESDYYLISGAITFFSPPISGTSVKANYTNAITLLPITGELVSGITDGVNRDFHTYYPVYGDYSIFNETIASVEATSSGLYL